jgi:hypothetical protein
MLSWTKADIALRPVFKIKKILLLHCVTWLYVQMKDFCLRGCAKVCLERWHIDSFFVCDVISEWISPEWRAERDEFVSQDQKFSLSRILFTFWPMDEVFFPDMKSCTAEWSNLVSMKFCTRVWNFAPGVEILYPGLKFCTSAWNFVPGFKVLYLGKKLPIQVQTGTHRWHYYGSNLVLKMWLVLCIFY